MSLNAPQNVWRSRLTIAPCHRSPPLSSGSPGPPNSTPWLGKPHRARCWCPAKIKHHRLTKRASPASNGSEAGASSIGAERTRSPPGALARFHKDSGL